jgi:hypothetical protein
VPITTPANSPESNGLAEAFIGTFKRDVVYPAVAERVGRIEKARTVVPFFTRQSERFRFTISAAEPGASP